MLLRSCLFVPAHNRKFIEKALICDADAIILDLEDSVPSVYRQEARNNIIEYKDSGKFEGKTVFIRINEMGTKDFSEDVIQLVSDKITGFMPSKIRDAEDIKFMDRLLSMLEIQQDIKRGKLLLAPLIETVESVLNIYEIVKASQRLAAICFGGEDYLNDLGSVYTYYTPAFSYPRAMIVNAARTAGIQPIDTPYLDINDLEGFLEAGKEAYKSGFAGCLLLNPRQIEIAHTSFSPDEEKIEYSGKLIEAVSGIDGKQDAGVAMYHGVMIGPPMLKRACGVMEQKRLIEEHSQRN